MCVENGAGRGGEKDGKRGREEDMGGGKQTEGRS